MIKNIFKKTWEFFCSDDMYLLLAWTSLILAIFKLNFLWFLVAISEFDLYHKAQEITELREEKENEK